MTKETIFENIRQLMPVLRDYQTKGSAIINPDLKLILRDTYQAIHPVQVDLSCSTCVLYYLNVLVTWYEREYVPPVKKAKKR
jgi:hypothetical protein